MYIGNLTYEAYLEQMHQTHRFSGTSIETGEEFALKLEHVSIDPSFLKVEDPVYQSLSDGVGIPRVHDFLYECEFRVMVFDLLGPSLEDLFNFCGRRFSLKTVLMLAEQLLHRLEYIHSKDTVHRDVKPENFVMGPAKCRNVVYITDMGLATRRLKCQIPVKPIGIARRHLIGTTHFASINGHLGICECLSPVCSAQILMTNSVQDPSDDLESLGYMFLYFLRGSLPWQGLKAPSRTQKEEMVLEKKKMSTDDLCKGLPAEFKAYFDHIRSTEFNQTPAYADLRTAFHNLFERENFDDDEVFDWTILKYLMQTQGDQGEETRSFDKDITSGDRRSLSQKGSVAC